MGKKLGKAHIRNRHKRWAREAFRKNQEKFQVRGDIIVSFTKTADNYQQIEEAILKAYRMAIQDRRSHD